MKKTVVLFLIDHWYTIDVDDVEKFSDRLDLSRSVTLISCQTADLVRYMKSTKQSFNVATIVDLECLDKQMSQEGKDFRVYKKWKLLPCLRYHKVIPDDFRLTESTIKECMEAIVNLYKQLLEKDEAENQRFNTIETAVNRIIYRRQISGIRIDLSLTHGLCKKLEAEIYNTKNALQRLHNVFDADNESQQISYLTARNFPLVKSPLFTFKARRNENEVCNLFYEMIRNQRDLDSLLFMLSHWGGGDHTVPTYYGFGTITSRITVREPGIQNLRKPNRAVIIADQGFKLLYIDYSQFEAGILASLSQDPALMKLYDSDIYEDLAKAVFGDVKKRSDAKVIFYRYMYGDKTLNNASKTFFQKFRKLEEFKKKIETEIEQKRRIGTVEGNFRFRNEEDYGWALSHLIQATASLIYKRALIRVYKEVSYAKFLIPMHDGTLYQIHNYWYDFAKKEVENIYKEEFAKYCPGITPRVNVSDKFHE